MKVLCIIPARGGSKGVKNKNLLEIDGSSLLAYAIQCAQASELIDRIVVSTDSEIIANHASLCQAQPSLRPPHLATDEANVVDTVLWELERLENENEFFDIVVLLQPTAPLRTGKDIDNAINLMLQTNADGVISVVAVNDDHPARMYKIAENLMEPLFPQEETQRRQDLPKIYKRNGCIYAVKTEILKSRKTVMPANKAAYIMDAQWAINVDTQRDVYVLEQLIKRWKETLS